MQPVNLVIGGVQKGGTTTLYEHLRQHPSISFGDRKELHVASHDEHFADPDFDIAAAYGERFCTVPNVDAVRYRADATPVYCYWPNAIERLAAYNPGIKLILIYRDPIERAYSHWQMEYARGNDRMSFPQAIRSGRARVATDPKAPGFHRVYSYVERGFYAGQLRRVLAAFPREQILLLENRMLRDDLAGTLGKIWDFLGVDALDAAPQPIKANSAPKIDYGYTFQDRDGEFLYRLFEWDIAAFAELSGLDVSHWGARYRDTSRIVLRDVLKDVSAERQAISYPVAAPTPATEARVGLAEEGAPYAVDAGPNAVQQELSYLREENARLRRELNAMTKQATLDRAGEPEGSVKPRFLGRFIKS